MKLALSLGDAGVSYLSQHPPNKPIWLLRGRWAHQAFLLLQQHCTHTGWSPCGFHSEQILGCVAKKLLLA